MSFIGVLASLEKTVPMGRLHMRPFQWYLKTHWKYPQSIDIRISCSEILKSYLSWWGNPNNVLIGSPLHAEEHNLLLFTDASVKGWGCTFVKLDSEWNVVGHRGKFAYKCSGIESSIFGSKVLPVPSNEQEGLGGLRQCNSSVLSQQARGDPFPGNVSNDMASDGILQPQDNFAKGSAHTGLSECDSRQPFTQGQNHTNRMVSSSQDFLMICQI